MVESLAPIRGLIGDAGLDTEVFLIGGTDERFGRDVDRPEVVEGRMPAPGALDEIALEEFGAPKLGAVGDVVRIQLATLEDWRTMLGGEAALGSVTGPTVELRVVGILRTSDDIEAEAGNGPGGRVSTAFVEMYDDLGGLRGAMGRLRQGDADVAAFESAVRHLLPEDVPHYVFPGAADVQGATDATSVMATGLSILTGISAGAALVVLALLMRRLAAAEAEELAALRALGFSRSARAWALIVAVSPALLGGLLVAVAAAVAASPLAPVGVARRAEPHPGLGLHWALLPAGLGLVVVVAAVAAVAGWRSGSSSLAEVGRHPSTASRWWPGMGPTAFVGSQLAVGTRRARSWGPAVGVAAGIGGVVAAIVFASSLSRLVDTPARWGWPADEMLEVPPNDIDRVAADLVDDARVAALAKASVGYILLGEQQTATYSVEPIRGTWSFTVVTGREPRGPDEIVLGADTLERLGASVGDLVDAPRSGAEPGDEPVKLRVVGRVVLPDVDNEPTDAAGMTPAGFAAIHQMDTAPGGTSLWLRYAPGVDADTVRAELADRYRGAVVHGGPEAPAQVRQLGRIESVPWAIATFLGVLGLAVLAYALVTRSRLALSTLRTMRAIGFVPAQVRATVRWQAVIVAAVAVAVGVPAGLLVGRTAWSLVAQAAGYANDPVATAWFVGAVAAGSVALAASLAELPARAAARRSAAAGPRVAE